MEQTRSDKNKRKKKVWKKIILFFMLILLTVGCYAGYIFYQTLQAANDSFSALDRGDKSDLRDEAVTFGKEPVSILLLGIEDYATGGSGGRSDTIMVATFNPDLKTMKLLSIPRDTKVYIPSRDKYDKINHSFNDGKESTIETVEEFLDIPIDYYATVNFEGFKNIIDEIGGVDVEVPFDFWEYTDKWPQEKIYFKEGLSHLNGEEALAYARMRQRDPNGDFGRNERQKQIISAMIDSIISPKNLLKIDEIAKHASTNTETNIKASEGISFITKFKSFTSDNIKSLTIEGTGGKDPISGIYYYIPDEDALEKLKSELQNHLEYKTLNN
ncbi:LCP family protein [Bacillus sp. AGMB 02131]|uniref:LCP family protein n=1 Tax=Peribacillus faecalis TaxID=2772559 RepID=A0A927D010_9BACI|nr:LCP family protein [Peribacillus faecalis]MBD3108509.1 LCP family protein [Peribacillus faecalis]